MPEDDPKGGASGDNKPDPNDPKTGNEDKGGSEWSEDRARATIERQRESEREAKAEAKRAKDELEELRKNLPEQERLTREKAEADARADRAIAAAKRTSLKAEVATAAVKLKFRDPELAMKFIDDSEVEWNDDGDITGGVRGQLEKAAKEYPFLIGAQSTGDAGDGGDGGTGGQTMSEMIRSAAGR
jgi:hypothetical protein